MMTKERDSESRYFVAPEYDITFPADFVAPICIMVISSCN